MRHFLYISCMIAGAVCRAQPDSTGRNMTVRIEALPAATLLPVFTADARGHRLQLLKDFGGPGYIGSLGGQFPLLNLHAFGKTLQSGLAATAYTTLNRFAGRGRVVNIDYFADILFDLKLNEHWRLRAGFGHTSQHLTDDALEAGMTARNYVKDYLQFFAARSFAGGRLLIYGGGYYFHNFKVTDSNIPYNLSKKIMLQAGMELEALRFGNWAYYIAADCKLRQEFDFGSTYSAQTGFRLRAASGKKLRIAYNHLGGYEERGQFYNTRAALNTLGLYFDF